MDKESFRNWKDLDASSLLWLHGIGKKTVPASCVQLETDDISWVWQNDSCVSIFPLLVIFSAAERVTLGCCRICSNFCSSKIIDDVAHDIQRDGHSLAYFYCHYGEEQRRDPASTLRSLVKQLSLQSPASKLPEAVLLIYENRKKAGDLSNHLSVEESKRLLIELCAGFFHTTLIIDALDECDAKTRGRLFDVLQNVVSESKNTRVKAFVTSRDDADLRKKFEGSPNVYIQERDNSGDINTYIRAEIDACIVNKRLLDGAVSSELRARIIHALEIRARGMYTSPSTATNAGSAQR